MFIMDKVEISPQAMARLPALRAIRSVAGKLALLR
jgi:hypothetical protein